MAREESEREDLMREATALVARVEIVPPDSEPVVAGFRLDGAFSVFFGEDPAYHFNAAGELRRAYCGGLLFKAMSGRLASLRRKRTASETQFLRHDLSSTEQDEFVVAMKDRLRSLLELLAADSINAVRQFPQDVDVITRMRDWLAAHPDPGIASRPNVAG